MARSATTTQLSARSRAAAGSRTARRLRREGQVPGVIYGGDGDATPVSVDSRELRHALAAGGAVVEISLDGAGGSPVVLKDAQHHPVTGETLHVDLLRVRLDRPIQASVMLELTGFDEAPGTREGGVLEQIARELTIEALPNEIPDVITHDVSSAELNDTILLSALTVPAGVTLLDDLEETVVATVILPRLSTEPDEEIEQETGIVGEEGESAEGEDEGAAPSSDAGE